MDELPYLSHASSSINANHLSINPFSVLAGKEADNTRDVDGKTNTVERTPGGSVLKINLVRGVKANKIGI